MRLRTVSAVVLVCTLAPRTAGADAPVRHEGKTLVEWIAQARGRSSDKSRDAIRALGRARFLVDAPTLVLPVLVEIAEGDRGVSMFTALDAIAAYGPRAREALGALRPSDEHPDVARAVARVLIGDGVEDGLRTWKEDAERQMATADRTTEGMKLPDELEYADTPFYHAMTGVNVALYAGGNLGLRAEGVAAFAGKVLKRPYGFLVASTVLSMAEELRAGAAPLAADLVPFLEDREPVHRARAANALAWAPGLSPESVKRMLKAGSKVTHVPTLRSIAQGVAVTTHDPAVDVVTVLNALAKHSDRVVAAWAVAGLVRRGADPEKRLPGLLANLTNAEPMVRVAAADGLLSIGRWSEATREIARARLLDPDLRVRWRCGALVARGGGDVEVALAGLALGIDGPDDVERVAAFEAVRALGPAAGALRERAASWSKMPFPLIAGPALRALDAIDGKWAGWCRSLVSSDAVRPRGKTAVVRRDGRHGGPHVPPDRDQGAGRRGARMTIVLPLRSRRVRRRRAPTAARSPSDAIPRVARMLALAHRWLGATA